MIEGIRAFIPPSLPSPRTSRRTIIRILLANCFETRSTDNTRSRLPFIPDRLLSLSRSTLVVPFYNKQEERKKKISKHLFVGQQHIIHVILKIFYYRSDDKRLKSTRSFSSKLKSLSLRRFPLPPLLSTAARFRLRGRIFQRVQLLVGQLTLVPVLAANLISKIVKIVRNENNRFSYHSGILLAQSHFPVLSSNACPNLHPLLLGICPFTHT